VPVALEGRSAVLSMGQAAEGFDSRELDLPKGDTKVFVTRVDVENEEAFHAK
jgi:hypothetical protein